MDFKLHKCNMKVRYNCYVRIKPAIFHYSSSF